MRVGMSTSCFFSREKLEDTIEIMSGIGVTDAEVFLNTLSEYEEPFARNLKKRAVDCGIDILSVHPMGVQFEMQMYTPYDRTVQDAESIFKKVLKAAAILEAKRYIYHGGLYLKNKNYPRDMERIGRVTGRCADMAAEYGLEFAYENVHWCWFSRPSFASDLLANCSSGNLCFNLDIKQAAQSGYPYSEYIDVMGKRLKSVHICDHIIDENGAVKPVAPFEGDTDFELLKEKLIEIDYDGPVILEIYAGNYRDYSHLKDIFEHLKEVFED